MFYHVLTKQNGLWKPFTIRPFQNKAEADKIMKEIIDYCKCSADDVRVESYPSQEEVRRIS